ncbi:hypothetical protein LCGC14_2535630 [marine sediment metagenome]|uniref:Uncharacterized protein n=1 Tax=marine sediment metagenome TaxID=412755 RepID=A0A0F9DKB1_9ZZZZ
MKKQYITVSIEKDLVRQIKVKFPVTSFNKALKAMLISSDDYEPVDDDKPTTISEVRYFVNGRLRQLLEQIDDRFNKIEENINN